jgi:hypothetical protein
MTTTGDVAKGILIFCCGYFIFLMIAQAITGQTALTVFMLVGFVIPLSIVAYGYVKDKKRQKEFIEKLCTGQSLNGALRNQVPAMAISAQLSFYMSCHFFKNSRDWIVGLILHKY